jgi:hypothetical protein
MAKITSKANLNIGTELTVNQGARTITLNVAGNLVAKDGCTWQALYSKMIDLWTGPDYNEFPFPFYTIDVLSGQFNLGTDGARFNNWTFAGSTRLYLRDGGWNEYTPTAPGGDGTSANGTINSTYAGVVSLGAVSTGSQLYYQLTNGGTATDFTYDDAANLGVQVFGDATHGNFTSNTYMKGYCREYAKKYTSSILADTGKTGTGAFLVNLLLSNSDDLDIVNNDTDVIDTPISPYTLMRIRYFPSAFIKDVDGAGIAGNNNHFGIVVDCGTHSGVDGSTSGGSVLTSATGGIPTAGDPYAGGTLRIHEGADAGTYAIVGNPTATTVTVAETFNTDTAQSFTLYPPAPLNPSLQQIYTFVQAKLRQGTSINDVSGGGSVIGKTATQLLGWTAKLEAGFLAPINTEGGGTGVIIEGVANADSNTVSFYDNGAVKREYPFSSAGVLNFNANLTSGGTGYYRMYLTNSIDPAGDDYGTANAITMNNADSPPVPIAGTISGATINFTVDFTGNTQGGRSVPTDPIPVTIVAGNAGAAKPVVTTATITASKTISISLVAETDRAYS